MSLRAPGFKVLLCDVEQRFLDRALAQIRTNLGREAAKGKLAEAEVEPALARITRRGSRGAARGGLCGRGGFGAVRDQVGDLSRPRPHSAGERDPGDQHFVDLDYQAGAQTQPSAQVIGMHFFNPVPVMALVEIVRGLQTSDATFATVRRWRSSWARRRSR
jgi:3-hydroxybutyryl-CoA dehydrogenase